ncbi:MAG: MFS family permease [Motiliproteus sp.]|jgi:MFS family permease
MPPHQHSHLHSEPSAPAATHTPAPRRLILSRRFGPFFLSQFLGAFNDNLFKNTLILIFVFEAAGQAAGKIDQLTNLAAGLFILPYLLFSALAGQLADRFEKSRLITLLKALEVLLMSLAGYALLQHQVSLLLALLFMMATQSALFSPIKHSIIPQHLPSAQWMPANGLIEAGTFAAILSGTLVAGVLYPLQYGTEILVALLGFQALCGWFSSLFIPKTPVNPSHRIDLHLWRQSRNLLASVWHDNQLRLLMLLISWFWFIGAAYLTQIPHYAEANLGGGSYSVSWLLFFFTLGIGAGSALCHKAKHDPLGRDLILIGLAGLLLAGLDLYWATPATPLPAGAGLSALPSLSSLRVTLDFVLIGLFGGLYIVPLYTLFQAHTNDDNRAQCFAANNILNALLMIASALAGGILLGVAGWSIPAFFVLLALLNLIPIIAVLKYKSSWITASRQRFRAKTP